MEILSWMESTAIADAVRTYGWIYPALESAHYIGIACLVGAIMLIDLRLLGLGKKLPLKTMITLLPFVWAGFFINLFSGGIIFIYGATNFGTNSAFLLKMLLIVLAGINAFLFEIAARRGRDTWVETGEAPALVKAIATLSFVLWLSVVTTGRWMAYV
jgi:energy-coupling factor transporter transmembrane protein EcfT